MKKKREDLGTPVMCMMSGGREVAMEGGRWCPNTNLGSFFLVEKTLQISHFIRNLQSFLHQIFLCENLSESTPKYN